MKQQTPITDKNSIEKLIPQRFPMVMVDAIWHYSPTEITAGLTITAENIFTHNQSLSEAGLIEHLAQSIALHKGYSFYLNDMPAPVGYIGSIKSIEIIRCPNVGEQVHTEMEVIQEFMDVTLVKLHSFVGDELIASGEMKTVLAKPA